MHPQKESKGAIAQLVEQRTENPCVPGSIPGGTTPPFIWAVLERGRLFLCKDREHAKLVEQRTGIVNLALCPRFYSWWQAYYKMV